MCYIPIHYSEAEVAAMIAPLQARIAELEKSEMIWKRDRFCIFIMAIKNINWPFYREVTMTESVSRPPLPPFTLETATAKVHAAEDAWNTRDPERVARAYTEDSEWRNRSEFFSGRAMIKEFLQRKWEKELDYRLKKELWCFMDNRIAVRFEYEWHDHSGSWYRACGNENWEFAENGLMMRRFASINDVPILESERKFRWERPPSNA